MKKILGMLVMVATFFSAGAQADVYVGGGLYATSISEASNGTSLDDKDVAPAVFLGWRPIELVGVELGYYDFGKFEDSGVSAEGSAVTVAGLLTTEIGPVGLYLKGGMADFSFKATAAGQNFKDDSTDPFGGVGLTVDLLDKIYVYGEFMHFASDSAVDVLGVGLRYNF